MSEAIQKEVQTLRDLRELTLARKELEVEGSLISKRIKKGIKLIDQEIASVEKELDQGTFIEGTEARVMRSPQLALLISDPRLEHIPEDNEV